jgi:hypothetical protein
VGLSAVFAGSAIVVLAMAAGLRGVTDRGMAEAERLAERDEVRPTGRTQKSDPGRD